MARNSKRVSMDILAESGVNQDEQIALVDR